LTGDRFLISDASFGFSELVSSARRLAFDPPIRFVARGCERSAGDGAAGPDELNLRPVDDEDSLTRSLNG
jgi:hypothetical protein